MRYVKLILLLTLLGLSSCNKHQKRNSKTESVEKFYHSLNHSDYLETSNLISYEFVTSDDGYEQKYIDQDYKNWMKWDSVFEPSYTILNMNEVNGIVEVQTSKIDRRIRFLHDDPIVMKELFLFDGDSITRLNRTTVSFNRERFLKRREEIKRWIQVEHPELDGFLHDQTMKGGQKYLRAIDLFMNK